jgi:hypothetical protein
MNLVFAFVFNVIVASCIIYYLKRLETISCKCALNFKHQYIFYFTCINLFFALINFAFGTVSIVRFIMLFVSIPLVIAAIINIVYTIQYVNELKNNDCACSESFYRELMYILAIINACAWIILILIIIPLAIQYPDVLKKTLNNKKFLKLYIKNGRPTNAL